MDYVMKKRELGNLAELFKENQFTYDGTNLKKYVDFIFRGYRRLGKRFYMKRIKFILGGNERIISAIVILIKLI